MTSQMKTESGEARSEGILPGAKLALTLLLLINLFNYIDRQVLAAVVDDIEKAFFPKGNAQAVAPALLQFQEWAQAHLGFKPELALIGVLGMAFMAVYMIGAPIFGRLADRYSRWSLVGVGVILWSLASGASGLAGGFIAMLLTRCFVGIGEAAYGPVAPTLISDYYPVKVRGQKLAWFYMAIPVGSALGYVLGGRVARSGIGQWGEQVLGIHAESWRWAFYIVVIPGILLGLWSFFMKEPPRGQTDVGHSTGKAKWKDYLILLRIRSYVFCTLGMIAMTFAIGGIAFWMAYYLKNQKANPPQGVTEIFGAVTVVAGFSATLLGGWVGDKLRPRFGGSYFLVSGVAMIIGFPFMLLTLHSSFPMIWVWLFLTCFCLFFNTGPTNTILANVTHPSIRAAGFAFNILLIHALGDVISPVIIGILSDRYSMNTAFSVVGAMFVVAGVFWLFGIRYLARDTELAPQRLSQ
jgi:MFS family permease